MIKVKDVLFHIFLTNFTTTFMCIFVGCSFELNQQSGEIRSPGSVLSGYPSLQTCQWSLKNPNMTVRTKNFTLDSDGDYLKVSCVLLI